MDDNDLKRLIESATDATRRHFDVVAERTDGEIEAVAEAVASLGAELRAGIEELRHETRRGFVETRP